MIEQSKQKLQAKLRVMPKNYAEGMSGFFGKDVSGSIPVNSYKIKMVPAVADKWERNLRNAFGA